jgi:hypothetical protein
MAAGGLGTLGIAGAAAAACFVATLGAASAVSLHSDWTRITSASPAGGSRRSVW